jgi:Prokaryotic Cytochrome C oxidase subunit IV
MRDLTRGRLFAAWTVLVAVTLISSQLGAWLGSAAAITAAVLAIAFAKAALVMFEFMELRAAPLALRALACIWLVLAFAALLACHFGLFTI